MNTLTLKHKNLSFLILFLIAALFNNTIKAQDNGITQIYGNAVKEIFVKGSLDGNNLFLVLGFENATEQFKKNIKNAVDVRNLQRIGDEFVDDVRDNASSIYNSNHDGDFVAAARNGLELSSESARFLVRSPLKSLKKIPASYKVSFERAREAYYETDNSIAASVKYAGHAVWANVKGAYFLVIEAPTKAVLGLAGTVLGVPASIAAHAVMTGVRITLDAIGLTFRVGMHALKAVVNGAIGVATMAYAGISTAVAITATTVVAGVIGAVNGVKWIASQPIKLFYTGRVKVATGLGKDLVVAMANALNDELDLNEIAKALGLESSKLRSNAQKYKAKLKLRNNEGKTAAIINLEVKNGQIQAKASIKRSHFKKLYKIARSANENLTKKEYRNTVKELLTSLIKLAALEVIGE